MNISREWICNFGWIELNTERENGMFWILDNAKVILIGHLQKTTSLPEI